MTVENLNLDELYKIIKQKINDKDKNSYSYYLSQKGIDLVTRKIGEEATEVVTAAFIDEREKNEKTRNDLVNEICDLYYHSLVLMVEKNISLEEIYQELTKRNSKK